MRKERLQRLFEVTDRISLELNQALVGSRGAGPHRRRQPARTARSWQGRGEDNRVVNFAMTGRERIGDVVDVRIVRAGPHSLVGESIGPDREVCR